MWPRRSALPEWRARARGLSIARTVRSSMRGRMLPSHRCRATIDASIILWNVHKSRHGPHDTNSDTGARTFERFLSGSWPYLCVKKAGASNGESPGVGAQDGIEEPRARRRTIEWGERDDETYRSRACVNPQSFAGCLQPSLERVSLSSLSTAGARRGSVRSSMRGRMLPLSSMSRHN